jgi:hypothetical protein
LERCDEVSNILAFKKDTYISSFSLGESPKTGPERD